MINQAAENLNREQGAQGGAERAKQKLKIEVSKLQNKEKREKQTIEEELQKIEDQEFSTNTTDKEPTNNQNISIPQTTTSSLDTKTQQAIEQLDRPEAEEGLKQAYTTIQQDIKNSNQDKNPIVRGLGNLVKKILGIDTNNL